MSERQYSGVILVGPSGAGKTWVQRQLVTEYGFWAPLHVTTRDVDQTDFCTRHAAEPEFMQNVAAGAYVAPMYFGARWHAFGRDDFSRLCRAEGRAVVICRPHEALLLQAMQGQFASVWLYAAQELTSERCRRRATQRDLEPTLRDARVSDDAGDERYRSLFRYAVRSDADAPARISRIVTGQQLAKQGASCQG